MTSLATYPQERLLRPWCGAVLVVLASMVLSPARCAAQVLTKGVSVQEAVTRYAVVMPEADEAGAMVVAVTQKGNVYYGIERVTPADLGGKLGPSMGGNEKLYIKADARVAFAEVAKVLDAVRAAGVNAPSLLTAQPEAPVPGKMVSPRGLQVFLASPTSSGAESPVVNVSSAAGRPTLKINHEDIAWEALQYRLEQLLQNRNDRTVLVKADGLSPYADVIRAIDACQSVGARVILATPTT